MSSPHFSHTNLATQPEQSLLTQEIPWNKTVHPPPSGMNNAQGPRFPQTHQHWRQQGPPNQQTFGGNQSRPPLQQHNWRNSGPTNPNTGQNFGWGCPANTNANPHSSNWGNSNMNNPSHHPAWRNGPPNPAHVGNRPQFYQGNDPNNQNFPREVETNPYNQNLKVYNRRGKQSHPNQAPGWNNPPGPRFGPDSFRNPRPMGPYSHGPRNGPPNDYFGMNNYRGNNPSNYYEEWGTASYRDNIPNRNEGAGLHNNRGNKRGNFNQRPGSNRGGRFQNKKGNKKKNNQKPSPKEEDLHDKFYCDTCDRGFPTEEKQKEHIDQHEMCPYEGCSYVAAPKLVKVHGTLQHKSGLAKKVWSLKSQEDVEKWREERKQNFPTAENIEKKKALIAERIARGEVLENKYFGKMKGKNYKNSDLKGARNDNRKRNLSENADESDSAKICKTDGTGDEGEDSGNENEGSKRREDKPFMTPEIKRAIKQRNKACTKAKKTNLKEDWSKFRIIRRKVVSLIRNKKMELGLETNADRRMSRKEKEQLDSSKEGIDSDETQKEENVMESKSTEQKTNEEELDNGKTENDEDSAECPSEIPVEKMSEDEEVKEGQREVEQIRGHRSRCRTKKRANHQRGQRNSEMKAKSRESLLEKLLANDIRHERNVILQCVHHIVKKNFFGIGQPSCDQASTNENDASAEKMKESQDTFKVSDIPEKTQCVNAMEACDSDPNDEIGNQTSDSAINDGESCDIELTNEIPDKATNDPMNSEMQNKVDNLPHSGLSTCEIPDQMPST